MRQAESPAQQNKERRVRRAYKAADIKSPGTPRYTAPDENFPYISTAPRGPAKISHGLADRFMAVVPTRECMPLLHLPHYHKADRTSQICVLLRQNDVIHCSHQMPRLNSWRHICGGAAGQAPTITNARQAIWLALRNGPEKT